MKLLLLHSDYLTYRVRDKTPLAEKITADRMKGHIDEPLVVFVTIEKMDEENPEQIAQRGVKEIMNIADQIHPKNMVLYPYVHLLFGSEPGSADVAVKILKEMERRLKEKHVVYRLPFGYYKEFNIRCKGHPLSEFSRVIRVEEEIETIEEKAKKIPSRFIILTPECGEHNLDTGHPERCEVLESYPLLKSFIYSEEVKGQPSTEPPSIRSMRKLELIDYEPASEPGMFRYYPAGALLKDLLEEWAYQIVVVDMGAMKIDTPILYNWDEPDIREQGLAFRERSYKVSTPKRTLVLRFAGDFGLFRMMKDAVFSYRHLPMRIYEISPSFRKEQRGELVGLRRCSFFHMPDLHSFCKDFQQAYEEFKIIFQKYTELLKGVNIDFALGFRIVEKFYADFKPIILELIRHAEKPALVELLGEAKHYWVVKSEHQAIDSIGGNAQLCTVQLDVEDSERYGIYYTDTDGERKGCTIIHTSVGSIERLIYAVLESSTKMKVPMLPTWLIPTQVRMIPVSERFVDYVSKLADEIAQQMIRVDVDDRSESVSKSVRDAETSWIPYIVVVGEKEVDENMLTVRVRRTGEILTMSLKELIDSVKEEVKGMPYKPLTLPKYLSKRAKFA